MNAPANERTLTELPYQLSSARQDRQLRALLSDYDFIDTKVGAFGPQPIIEDYALLKVDRDAVDLRPLLLALESSAHVLQRDRAQTAPQLVARLGAEGSGPVADLVSAATAWRGRPWLRPLRASLVASGPVLRTLVNPVEHINDIAFAPSGRFLVTCANEPVVRVWDAHSGVQLRTLEGHSEWVKCVAVLPDERTVLSGSFEITIRLWDLDAHHEPVVHNTGGRVWSLALLPGGRHAVVGAGERVQLWDLQRGKVLRDGIGHSEEVTALAVTSDGKTVLSLSKDQTVRVWEIASMKCVRTHRGEDVDPQRRWKETGDGGKRSAHPEWTPYALALTHDGRSFLAARRDESIRMRSVATGAEMAKFVGHDGTVDCVAVDRAGSIVVSGGWDRTLRTWGSTERSSAVSPTPTRVSVQEYSRRISPMSSTPAPATAKCSSGS